MRVTRTSERPFYLFCLREDAAEEIAAYLRDGGIPAFVHAEPAEAEERRLFRIGVPPRVYLSARRRLVEDCPQFPVCGKFGDEPIFETTAGRNAEGAPLGLFQDLRDRSVTDHAIRESIASFYLQADLHERKRALEVFETFGDDREEVVVDLLVEVCRTSNEERLWELASFLAREDQDPSLEPLLALLSDPSTEVRRRAVMSLGKIGDRQILPDLVSLYLDPSSEIQIEAADAVWRLTGTDDGFEPELAAEEKTRIVQRWQETFPR